MAVVRIFHELLDPCCTFGIEAPHPAKPKNDSLHLLRELVRAWVLWLARPRYPGRGQEAQRGLVS